MGWVEVIATILPLIFKLLNLSKDTQKRWIDIIEEHSGASLDNVRLKINYKQQVEDLKKNDDNTKA